jgi:hypothetical protein
VFGGQCSVWRAADGSPRVVSFVARAFQPEHIAESAVRRGVLVCGVWGVVPPHPRAISPRFTAARGGSGRWAATLVHRMVRCLLAKTKRLHDFFR